MEIQYKGYSAKIFYLADVDIFYGEILNCDELIVFLGSTVASCIEAIHSLIDSHLTYNITDNIT